MKNFYKGLCFILPLCFSVACFAHEDSYYVNGPTIQGPFKIDMVQGGEVSVLSTDDREYPVSLVLDITDGTGKKTRKLVDKYDVAGSPPKIDTVFFYPVRGVRNVIVLVSWELTSRGLGTYGDYYQVYAYEPGGGGLVPNNKIRFDKHMTGIEGYQEGSPQSFLYKNAAAIKSYLKTLN